MTAQQLVGLAIRIAALLIFIIEIRSLSWWFTAIQENINRMPQGMDLTFLIGSMVVLLLCVGLALYPMPLARILIPKGQADHQVSSYTFQEIETLGLVLLGLWILSDGIPDAVHQSFLYSYFSSTGTVKYFWSATKTAEIASITTEMLIGFGLIVGRQGVRTIWKKFRNAGWEPDSP